MVGYSIGFRAGLGMQQGLELDVLTPEGCCPVCGSDDICHPAGSVGGCEATTPTCVECGWEGSPC